MSRGRRFARVLLVVIALGCVARALYFALDLEIYHDDAYLMNNALAKSYRELVGPLANNQAAPPAFLWVSKWLLAATRCDWASRLLPFLAGVIAVFVFYQAAREVLTALGARLATALLAASHAPIVYSVRAKPYAIDLLVATVVMFLLVRWLRRPRQVKYVVVLAAIAPIVFWLSYPSTLMLAGSAMVIFWYAITHRALVARGFWPAWIALTVSGMAGGAVLYRFHLAPCLSAAHTEYLHHFWAGAFPPVKSPLRLVGWLVTTHMGKMYAYPVGEDYLASAIPFLLWLVGCVSLMRHQKQWMLAALLAPQALLFVVAALSLYPYGGHSRLSMFLAPSMCLLIAAGILQVARGLNPPGRTVFLTIVSLTLVVAPYIHIAGAALKRLSEQRSGSIKRDLTGLLDSRRSGDIFHRVGAPAPLAGQGANQQIAEYYLQLLPWPSPLSAPIPRDALPGERLLLIRLLGGDESVADAPANPLASDSEAAAAWAFKRTWDIWTSRTRQHLSVFEYQPAQAK